jgi:hypothetical protein
MKFISRLVFGIFLYCVMFLPVMAWAQDVHVNRDTYDFGSIIVGETSTKTFTIRNDGPGDVEVAIVVLTTEEEPVIYDGPDFSITMAPLFPVIIPQEENVEIEVTFSPKSNGNFSVYLFTYAITGNPREIFVPLTGTGVASSANIKEFNLSGVEIIKGIDIGDVRYGTTFMGNVYEGLTKAGYWWTVIRHTDTENIEVCGGTNNLLNVKLVVVLNDGSLAGNRMVLGLQDPSIVEDVVWDAMAPICGPACYDEDCACPNNPDLIESWDCASPMPDDYGPVATIENLGLKKKFGSTLSIENAYLSGWLCHNWAFIPRVAAALTVVLED